MSILQGKQYAGAGAIAMTRVNAIIPTVRRELVMTIKLASRYFFTTIYPTIPAFSCGRQKYL
jgi:hypothetical protein